MELNEPVFAYELGNQIKKLRTNSGISIKQMSDSSGIDFDTLEQIEAGNVSIKLNDFVRIAKYLNVDPSELIQFSK